MADISLEEARLRMIQKRFGGNASGANVGGMRKNKGTHKSVGDDKKLGGVLKKMGFTEMKGMEEVNIFKDDGTVIHIKTPKMQMSVPSNTYVVSGPAETKKMEDLLPGILNQLGPESMDRLRDFATSQYGPGAGAGAGAAEEEEDDDDDVPDLVENFEEAANAKK